MNEVEVKYQLTFLPKVKKLMDSHGFVFKEKHFERNFIFDTDNYEFKNANKLFRLRLSTKDLYHIKGFLTIKFKNESEFKSSDEYEIELDQPNVLLHVFKNLFGKHFEYQKFRSTYYSKDLKTTACVDELPFGTFLELEAHNEVQLKETIDFLKLKPFNPVVKSYPALCGSKNQTYEFAYVKKAFGRKNVNEEFVWD